MEDLYAEIRAQTERKERTLVTTLTKRMAEDLTDYLGELGLKVRYLHSEIETIERVEILRDLRLGTFDVLVGINLLREGLDLPEVSLIAILDADKIGFLRSATSLIQTIGRAARNVNGRVIMYADRMSDAMKLAIQETERRRKIQEQYNTEHGITPMTISKSIQDILVRKREEKRRSEETNDRGADEQLQRPRSKGEEAAHPGPGGGDVRAGEEPRVRARRGGQGRDQEDKGDVEHRRRRRRQALSRGAALEQHEVHGAAGDVRLEGAGSRVRSGFQFWSIPAFANANASRTVTCPSWLRSACRP